MLDAPFKIGDVYWREAGGSAAITIDCPMCSGNKYVTVILGNDERYNVECEACGMGYRGPQGTITEYDVTPRAEQFVIDVVVSWRDDQWSVGDPTGRTAYFHTLYATEAEALTASVKRAEKLEESNMKGRRKKKYGKVSSWKIQYHQRQIAEFEKQIAWHRKKIDAKKALED